MSPPIAGTDELPTSTGEEVSSSSAEDLGRLYDEEYFQTGCGPIPYVRTEPRWADFFGKVADELVRTLQPKRVLDAGCALGFLVEAFWDRGVEAWGIDISRYAIDHVRRDMRPYCRVGSLADGIEGRFDLVTCIEVVEHMPGEQSTVAIGHMARVTDTILFSSTPYDFEEPTHINVRPLLAWLDVFREHGFSPDLQFDAGFVCSHAILFRRRDALPDDVLRLYSQQLQQRREISVRDARIAGYDARLAEYQGRIAALEGQAGVEKSQIEALRHEKQELAGQLMQAGNAREALTADRERAAADFAKQLNAVREELTQAHEAQNHIRAELEAAVRHLELVSRSRRMDSPHPPEERLTASGGAASETEVGRDSELLRQVSTALKSHGATLRAVEYRIGALEKRDTQLAQGLESILQSKIWRTLVRAGGLIHKLLGL